MSAGLRPRLHPGTYAFVSVPADTDLGGLAPVVTVREAEGLTLVLPEPQAVARAFAGAWPCRWITLELTTSLDLVGLTARFAAALADRGVACNVVAGARHDHLFVPVADADAAVAILAAL